MCGQLLRSKMCASRFARITMRAAGVVGCRASLIAPVRRCGGPSEAEMENQVVRRASPAIFALTGPKPQLGRFTKAMDPDKTMPSWRSGITHGFCVTRGHPPIASEPTPSPRLWATAPGATPARLCEHTMRVDLQPSKAELSTLVGITRVQISCLTAFRTLKTMGIARL